SWRRRGLRRVQFASRVPGGFRRDGNVGAYAEVHVRCWNDASTPFGGGRQNSVVGPKVSARSGHQRCEFGNKVASLENDRYSALNQPRNVFSPGILVPNTVVMLPARLCRKRYSHR